MKNACIAVLLILLPFILYGCKGKDMEFQSTLYDGKYLSELSDLSCEDYKQTALCEAAAFLFNIGHFSSSYSRINDQGKITMTGILGDMSRRVPLRCDLDTLLQELVRIDNEKGVTGRFIDSFSLLGQRIIVCDKKNKK